LIAGGLERLLIENCPATCNRFVEDHEITSGIDRGGKQFIPIHSSQERTHHIFFYIPVSLVYCIFYCIFSKRYIL
jgi:hypothetical protein